jgi:ribosomal protein L37E
MTCPVCGRRNIADDNDYCTICGYDLHSSSRFFQNARRRKVFQRGFLAVLLVCLLVVAGFSSGLFGSSGSLVTIPEEDVPKAAEVAVIGASRVYDFCMGSWNMSMNEVIASEGKAPDYRFDAALTYGGKTFAELPCTAYYLFESGALARGEYVFDIEHEDYNQYIVDFAKLKTALTSLFGEPFNDRVIWTDERFKDYPEDYGLALANGYSSYSAEWNGEGGSIVLRLDGNRLVIRLVTLYQSPDAAAAVS